MASTSARFRSGVAEAANSWTTPLNGTAGTVIVTSVGSGRIAGTFSFTAADITNPSSTRSVTGGAFDMAVTGTPGTVQPYQGSSMRATFGGTPWIGATIVTVAKSGGVYSFGGSSNTGGAGSGISNVFIALALVNGPGTFQLGGSSVNQVQVSLNSTAYSSSLAGSSGAVVVTSVDANRLKGTFSATLSNGAGGSLTVTDGTFDIGLGH